MVRKGAVDGIEHFATFEGIHDCSLTHFDARSRRQKCAEDRKLDGDGLDPRAMKDQVTPAGAPTTPSAHPFPFSWEPKTRTWVGSLYL